VREELGREIALAIEHLESIRVLLEISRGHQQPVPRAVPTNLDLVLKHLRTASKHLHPETPTDVRASALQVVGTSTPEAMPTHITRAF
jgi:hypothetical protein